MWNTPHGERVLEGPERSLYQAGLSHLLFHMEEFGERFDTNVVRFDTLSDGQRAVVLHQTTLALLRREFPPPEVTPEIASALRAVYLHLGEVWDEELSTSHRAERPALALLRAVIREFGLPIAERELPQAFSSSEYCQTVLLRRILHEFPDDEGFVEATLMDQSEGSVPFEEWAVSLPRDPKEAEAASLLAELRELSSR